MSKPPNPFAPPQVEEVANATTSDDWQSTPVGRMMLCAFVGTVMAGGVFGTVLGGPVGFLVGMVLAGVFALPSFGCVAVAGQVLANRNVQQVTTLCGIAGTITGATSVLVPAGLRGGFSMAAITAIMGTIGGCSGALLAASYSRRMMRNRTHEHSSGFTE